MNVLIFPVLAGLTLYAALDPPQHKVGAGAGAGGAVDPAVGATGPNVCPFHCVMPCISSINNKGLSAVSPKLNVAKPNT